MSHQFSDSLTPAGLTTQFLCQILEGEQTLRVGAHSLDPLTSAWTTADLVFLA